MFKNRDAAAKELVDKLLKYKEDQNAVVVAIPRGGVPIGKIISEALHIPLDLVLSKKIGHPFHKEFAVGAVTMQDIILSPVAADVPDAYIEKETERIRALLKHRFEQYYGTLKPLNLTGKTTILVDDGIATGNTLISCIKFIKKQAPKRIVVALPVAPKTSLKEIESMPEVDETICLLTPSDFYAVGQFYEDFRQVSDDDVIKLISKKGGNR